jgi:hypothetical protein
MQLEHERLDVYELALEFLAQTDGIIEGMPRGRRHAAQDFFRTVGHVHVHGMIAQDPIAGVRAL